MQNNEHNEAPDIIPEMLLGMRDAEIPPQFIYAYKKTGVIVLSDEWQQKLPLGALEKWNKAIEEYFALEVQAEARLS